MTIETKGQFAKRIGRHPAFVSRAIQSGKLMGDALIGEGRSTRINVRVAMEQLGRALDLSQQLAQEKPILPLEVTAPPAPAAVRESEEPGIHEERAEQVRLRNQRLRLELEAAERAQAIACGELVRAADVAVALRRQLGPLVATFDEVPAAVAKAISEAHGVPYADALITVRGAMRQQRMAWAERARLVEAEAA